MMNLCSEYGALLVFVTRRASRLPELGRFVRPHLRLTTSVHLRAGNDDSKHYGVNEYLNMHNVAPRLLGHPYALSITVPSS